MLYKIITEIQEYMIKVDQNKSNYLFNKILKEIILKKKYFRKLKTKIKILQKIFKDNYKKFNIKTNLKRNTTFLITYIVKIRFSKSNTLFEVIDCFGKLKFFCSAGCLAFNGKTKKSRILVLKSTISFLLKKIKFLKNRAITIHLNNVGFRRIWILKKLEKFFFFKSVTGFSSYSYNGCRKKKTRRKK